MSGRRVAKEKLQATGPHTDHIQKRIFVTLAHIRHPETHPDEGVDEGETEDDAVTAAAVEEEEEEEEEEESPIACDAISEFGRQKFGRRIFGRRKQN